MMEAAGSPIQWSASDPKHVPAQDSYRHVFIPKLIIWVECVQDLEMVSSSPTSKSEKGQTRLGYRSGIEL